MLNVHKVVIKKQEEGSLHQDMHVPQGKKIPASAERHKLAIAKQNHDGPLEKKILFALNFGHKG